jgi:Ca-activated chloride channel family protein
MVMVLDASGSMREPHGDGRTRFQAGVAALRDVVATLPEDMEVGLRIYGSRIEDGPGSCEDSELAVPVGPVEEPALRRALGAARPLGNTPIAYSLREAAKDLGEEGSRTIVLVSDGEESCGGDPCRVARELTGQGLDLHVDVVGFQVDDAARNQLTCVAQAGRGTFYDAPDAAALVGQLTRLSSRAARAYVPRGVPIEGADDATTAPTLEPEVYLDTIGDGGETETYLLDPAPGSTVHVSATDRPTLLDLSDSEQLELLVTTGEGAVCGQERGTGQGAFDRLAPITAAVTVSGEELAECGPPPYAVVVNRFEGDEVMPLEVTYVEEPEVRDVAALPPGVSEDYASRGRPARSAGDAYGAPSFTAAPILEPGTYTDSLLVGETLFYGVELDWGEQLACEVEFGRSAPVNEALENRNPTAKVAVHGPMHDEFFDSSQIEHDNALFNASRPVRVWSAAPPVRYRNREADPQVWSASLPGTYYCAAFLNGSTEYAAAGEVPIRVGLTVTGTAGEGAPDYVETETPTPSSTATATPAPDQGSTEPAASSATDAGVPGLSWLALGLVVAGVAGAAVAWRVRRR